MFLPVTSIKAIKMSKCFSRPCQNSGLLFVFGECSGLQRIPLNTNLLHRTLGYHQQTDNTQKILHAPAWKLVRRPGAADAHIKPIKARRRTELGMTKKNPNHWPNTNCSCWVFWTTANPVRVEAFCQHDSGIFWSGLSSKNTLISSV